MDFDDELFDEKRHVLGSSGSSHTRASVADEDIDQFYEKLGGSLYGGASSTTLTHRPRFSAVMSPPTVPEEPFGDPHDLGLEYPPTAYRFSGYDEFGEFKNYEQYDQIGENLMTPLPASVNFALAPQPANDYNVNLLEEPADSDPFGDDDSLFSDTEDVHSGVRRTATSATLRRRTGAVADPDGDDFRPRLNYTKTIKRARLVRGNYVIDAPVPQALLDSFVRPAFGDANETSFVRYSGVTCGPSNFGRFRYDLRQLLYLPPRETEIMVCITMFNEDELLLARTLKGVFDNIRDLSRRKDPTWGDGLWKKVTVVIVNDGRLQLHERTQKLLTALGVFQDGYAKSKVNDKPVKAHVYEYTTTVGIERVLNDRVYLSVGDMPVQMVFCLKEKNARKINSHRWCFQAFAPLLRPKVVVLLDCGTKASKDAFYNLWAAFKDPRVAGACGEIRAGLGPGKRLLANPLVAAQNFEYKILNVLDKPMESVFGFITVLPGAFSAYRWDALLNVDGQGPLEKYFKGEFLHQETQISDDDDEFELKEKNFQEAGIFTSNMYLAEDRILCFELVAKRSHNYVLRYVSAAKAETDVPEQIDDFVLQRRRWLNGSLFAALYSVVHWTELWRSNHSLLRKLWLQLQFWYQFATMLVSWFSLASFFLVFRILTKNLGSGTVGFTLGKYLATAFLWIYVGCVVCTFVLAFGNTPRGTRKFYYGITVFFAVLMAYLTFAAAYLAVRTVKLVMSENHGHFTASMLFTNQKFRDLVVSMLSTYLLYGIGAIIHGEPLFMVTSFIQYLLLSPSYINVLNIYSFCNIHDVSWGNRDTPQAKDLGVAKVLAEDGLVTTAVPGVEQELEDSYNSILDDLKVPPPPVVAVKNKKAEDDLYYALVRTVTVLVWMLTNGILVAVVLAAGGNSNDIWNDLHNATVFLTVILWVVCALAAFRLGGSVLYLMMRAGRAMRWWDRKKGVE